MARVPFNPNTPRFSAGYRAPANPNLPRPTGSTGAIERGLGQLGGALTQIGAKQDNDTLNAEQSNTTAHYYEADKRRDIAFREAPTLQAARAAQEAWEKEGDVLLNGTTEQGTPNYSTAKSKMWAMRDFNKRKAMSKARFMEAEARIKKKGGIAMHQNEVKSAVQGGDLTATQDASYKLAYAMGLTEPEAFNLARENVSATVMATYVKAAQGITADSTQNPDAVEAQAGDLLASLGGEDMGEDHRESTRNSILSKVTSQKNRHSQGQSEELKAVEAEMVNLTPGGEDFDERKVAMEQQIANSPHLSRAHKNVLSRDMKVKWLNHTKQNIFYGMDDPDAFISSFRGEMPMHVYSKLSEAFADDPSLSDTERAKLKQKMRLIRLEGEEYTTVGVFKTDILAEMGTIDPYSPEAKGHAAKLRGEIYKTFPHMKTVRDELVKELDSVMEVKDSLKEGSPEANLYTALTSDIRQRRSVTAKKYSEEHAATYAKIDEAKIKLDMLTAQYNAEKDPEKKAAMVEWNMFSSNGALLNAQVDYADLIDVLNTEGSDLYQASMRDYAKRESDIRREIIRAVGSVGNMERGPARDQAIKDAFYKTDTGSSVRAQSGSEAMLPKGR